MSIKELALQVACPLCGAFSGNRCHVLARSGAGRNRFAFSKGKHVVKRTSIPHRQRLNVILTRQCLAEIVEDAVLGDSIVRPSLMAKAEALLKKHKA